MPSFRDYTTLLWIRALRSRARPPVCSLGLFPKPQTLAGTTLSTQRSQTPKGLGRIWVGRALPRVWGLRPV